MAAYLLFPVDFLKFWFLTAPKEIILFSLSLNSAFLQMFSLPLMLRTFFKPIKNEYRKGLVAFSIGMGMVVKSWIILVDLIFLLFLLSVELLILSIFLVWPFATVWLLFA
jgi:hypothetical protein